ncbi:MAG: hypothetical protein JW915_15505 [Chitinispirillaceae bacterium]|nr:hypothetical protein [Chitinispirillaceae bacterium]
MGYRWILILLATLIVACSNKPEYTLSKEDLKNMRERYIFNQNGKKAYMPLLYGLKNYVFKIFPVPGSNRVGTLEYDNGFTLIEFKEEELNYDLVVKDYEEEVYGDFKFSFAPVYSEDELIYGQNSRFHCINLKKRSIHTFDLFGNIIKYTGEYFYRIQYTGTDSVFLCEKGEPNTTNLLKNIKVIKFGKTSSEQGNIFAGVNDITYSQPWQLSQNVIFTYDSAANKLLCHTVELKPTIHPFAEIFNRNNRNFRKLKEFLIHPTLPFGIVVEIGKDWDSEKIDAIPIEVFDSLIIPLEKERDRHTFYLLRWDTNDTNKQFVPIFTEPSSIIAGLHPKTYSDFQWSPDGKWLVFRDETQYEEWQDDTPISQENPVFIALPIKSDNSLYIGEPLYLGKVMRENATPESSAWVQKPVSFVVSDGLVLYKWDLDNISTAMQINSPNDVVKTN